MEFPKLSIIIVSFNCRELLEACLRSIYSSDTRPMETIVIDNASVDGTREMLKSWRENIRLVENSVNLGHPRAVDQGMDLARGEAIMILDADTEVRRDAISLMLAVLRDNPEVSMVSPRVLNPDGSLQETARNFPTVINGIFGRRSLMARIFPNNRFIKKYLDRENLDKMIPYRVEFISAACMLFRRSVLTTVGKWDQGYQCYWVDADWCMRFRKKNEKIFCVPQAVIVHHEQNKAFQKKSPKRILNFHLGALRLYRIHYTLGYLDPRYIAAAVLLAIRTVVLMIANTFLGIRKSVKVDPLSIKKSES